MNLLNRLKCLCVGYKWEKVFVQDYDWIDYYGHWKDKCSRCGKVKEEWI